MNNLKFTTPNKNHKYSILDYKKEHYYLDEYIINGSCSLTEAVSYEDWLEQLKNYDNKRTFLIMPERGNILIGIITLQKKDNNNIFIQFGVRPAERNKGYELDILKMAINYCKELKASKIFFMCDKDNKTYSETAIKSGGELFEEKIDKDGICIQTFEINIA